MYLLNLNSNVINYLKIIYFSDIIFDPESTIYGPHKLDANLNLIRAFTISYLQKNYPKILQELILDKKNYPPLINEILMRILLNPIDDEILNENVFNCIIETAIFFQVNNAPVKPREPVFTFLFYILKLKNIQLECLKSTTIINGLLRFVYEKGLSKHIFSNLLDVLLNISKENILDIKPLITHFLEKVQYSKELSEQVYDLISNVLKFRPYLYCYFQQFFNPMVEYFLNYQNINNFKRFIAIIDGLIQSKQSICQLSYNLFTAFIKYKEFVTIEILSNLLAGTSCASQGSKFLINNPCFLPLFFIIYGNTNQIGKILNKFLFLVENSDFNSRAFHDGDIDLIFLRYFEMNSSKITYKGIDFELNINKDMIEECVIPILQIILSSKSSYQIAKLVYNLIITKSNPLIMKVVMSIFHTYNSLPKQIIPIGNFPKYAEVSGFNGSQFSEFSLSFYLKPDVSVLSGCIDTIHLISFSNQSNSKLSISFQGCSLFLIYDFMKTRTMVPICQHITSNEWSRFVLIFKKNKTKSRISIYKDFSYLHDSEFLSFNFGKDQIEMDIGGISLKNSKKSKERQYGMISDISFFPYAISNKELLSLMSYHQNDISNFAFSTMEFPNKIVEKTCELTFLKQKYNVIFKYNSIIYKILPEYMHYFIPNLIKSIEKSEKHLIYKSLSLINQTINKTNDKNNSYMLSTVLLRIATEIDYSMFNTICSITSEIENSKIKELWVNDLILNCNLWSKSKYFKSVVHFWSTNLFINFNNQLHEKRYIIYILSWFNKLYENEDYMLSQNDFITFIKRLFIFDSNLSEIKCLFKNFLQINKENDRFILIYLDIICCISNVILSNDFEEVDCLLPFLKSTNTDIVLNTLLVFHQLYGKEFHNKIFIFLSQMRVNDDLLIRLEEKIDDYPNLTTLTSALALTIGKSVSKIPKFISFSSLSFVFPILLAFNNKTNSSKILDFISRNSMNLDNLICFSFFLYANNNYDFYVFYQLISFLFDNYKSYSIKKAYSLLKNATYPLFFHRFKKNNISQTLNEMISKEYLLDNEYSDDEKFPSIINNYESLKNLIYDFDFENIQLTYYLEIDKNNEIKLKELFKMIKSLIFYIEENSKEDNNFDIPDEFYQLKKIVFHFDQRKEMTNIDNFNNFNLLIEKMNENYNEHLKGTLKKLFLKIKQQMENKSIPDIDYKYDLIDEDIQDAIKSEEVSIVKDSTLCLYFTPFLNKRVKTHYERPFNKTKIKQNSILIKDNNFISVDLQISDQMFIVKSNYFINYIYFNKIRHIIYMNEQSVLIVEINGNPYLFDFQPNSNSALFEMIKKSFFINIDFYLDKKESIKKKASIYAEKWINHEITTFEFINILNLFSGKTYFNSLNRVSFPGDNNEDLQPELFYDYNSRNFEDVYKHRQSLEKNENIHKYIYERFNDLFDCPLDKRKTFEQEPINLQQKSMKFNNRKILFASQFRNCNVFFIVLDDGNSNLIHIDFNEGALMYQDIQNVYCFEDIQSVKFYPSENYVVAYDGKKLYVFTKTNPPIIFNDVYFEQPLFFGKLFLSDPSSLSLLNSKSIYNSTKICNVSSKILLLSSNYRMKIFVTCSEDCKVRIKKLNTFKKISTVYLGKELPVKLLITKTWGVILVKTINSLFVLSVNGDILKIVDNFPNIVNWNTYTSKDGFDFVVFETDDHKISYFDVFYPEQYKNNFIFVGIMKSEFISYNLQHNSFIIIYQNLTIVTLPLTNQIKE